MNQVIAMHGWSGDSNTWKLWAEQFGREGWLWQSVERGYGEITPFNPVWVTRPGDDSCQRRVIIAHSLGTHLIKNEIWETTTDVVLLASFSRFIPKGIESRFLRTACLLDLFHD